MAGSRHRSRRAVLEAIGVLGLTSLAGCSGGPADGNESSTESDGDGGGSLTIFHPESLSTAFAEGASTFENTRAIPVSLESAGSIESTKKITEQGRAADVLAVSDFRLLRDRLQPAFGSWYVIFATNAMTIAYTEESPGADSVSSDNWWEVLGRDDVTFAHADPTIAASGYRAVQSLRLGGVPFEGSALYTTATAEALEDDAVVVEASDTPLLEQLRAGDIDYAWTYQSASTVEGVQTVDLQRQVALSRLAKRFADHYAKATVEVGGESYAGAPIAYGITIPSVAGDPETGAAWIAYLLSTSGRTLLEEHGLDPVAPAVVPSGTKEALPDLLAAYVRARDTLGPLEL